MDASFRDKMMLPSIEVDDEVIIDDDEEENPFGYVSPEDFKEFLIKMGFRPETFLDDN